MLYFATASLFSNVHVVAFRDVFGRGQFQSRKIGPCCGNKSRFFKLFEDGIVCSFQFFRQPCCFLGDFSFLQHNVRLFRIGFGGFGGGLSFLGFRFLHYGGGDARCGLFILNDQDDQDDVGLNGETPDQLKLSLESGPENRTYIRKSPVRSFCQES